MNETTFEYDNEILSFVQSRYISNNGLYIGLVCEDGEAYSDVSTNLDLNLPDNFICVRSDKMSAKHAMLFLEEKTIAEKTDLQFQSGFCCYDVYIINVKKLDKIATVMA